MTLLSLLAGVFLVRSREAPVRALREARRAAPVRAVALFVVARAPPRPVPDAPRPRGPFGPGPRRLLLPAEGAPRRSASRRRDALDRPVPVGRAAAPLLLRARGVRPGKRPLPPPSRGARREGLDAPARPPRRRGLRRLPPADGTPAALFGARRARLGRERHHGLLGELPRASPRRTPSLPWFARGAPPRPVGAERAVDRPPRRRDGPPPRRLGPGAAPRRRAPRPRPPRGTRERGRPSASGSGPPGSGRSAGLPRRPPRRAGARGDPRDGARRRSGASAGALRPGFAAQGALPTARLADLFADGVVADWTSVSAAEGIAGYPYFPSLTPGRVAWTLALLGLVAGRGARLAGRVSRARSASSSPSDRRRRSSASSCAPFRSPARSGTRRSTRSSSASESSGSPRSGPRRSSGLSGRRAGPAFALLAALAVLDRGGGDAAAPPDVPGVPPRAASRGPRGACRRPRTARLPRASCRSPGTGSPPAAVPTESPHPAGRRWRSGRFPWSPGLFGVGTVLEKDYDFTLPRAQLEWVLFVEESPADSPVPLALARAAGALAVVDAGPGPARTPGASAPFLARPGPARSASSPRRPRERTRGSWRRASSRGAPVDAAFLVGPGEERDAGAGPRRARLGPSLAPRARGGGRRSRPRLPPRLPAARRDARGDAGRPARRRRRRERRVHRALGPRGTARRPFAAVAGDG